MQINVVQGTLQLQFDFFFFIFFFNDTATTEIYTLSLHDALPIFTIVASLVAEHRLQTWRLSNCGSRA